MRPLHALAVSALLAAVGCNRPGSQQATAPAGQPSAAPSGDAAAAQPAVPKGPTAYVTTVSALRREPTDAAKVPGKPGAKEVANYIDVLYRGEKVAVLETREDWARVRSSGEKEGWMKRSSLFEGDALKEATILAPVEVFDRPDLLAANAKRKLDPGTFVIVVKERAPFSEVNFAGGQDVWVLSERLNTSEKEVMVSKIVEKVRYLMKSSKKDDALANLAIAKQVADGSVLVGVLEAELGVAPAAGDGTTPTVQPAAGTEGSATPTTP